MKLGKIQTNNTIKQRIKLQISYVGVVTECVQLSLSTNNYQMLNHEQKMY